MPAKSRPEKFAYIIAQQIVQDIHRDGIRPGGKLPPERAMLDKYDVGRGTLRESLRFLELQGVLALRPGPNGGPVVKEPDFGALATSLTLLLQFRQAPFRTIIEARHVLEPAIAALAAQRMKDEAIAELGLIVAGVRAHVHDERAFLEHTRRFHAALARGSGNELFAYIFHAIMDILDGAAIGMQFTTRSRAATATIQEQIHEAVSRRDVDAARSLMQDHMDAVVRYAERHYADAIARPIEWR